MDFALSEEQIMLRDGAARYLTEHYSFDQRRRLLERDGVSASRNGGNSRIWGGWRCRSLRIAADSAGL